MPLPFFFVQKLPPEAQNLILNEEQSKHMIQVLRMEKEETILLTDGKGIKAHSVIIDDHRKRCEVKIISVQKQEKFRVDRLQNILISAMLQSQQCWLPVLHEPIAFKKLIEENKDDQKFIAHCLPQQKQPLPSSIHHSSLILIGPEGDFSEDEIQSALNKNFQAVTLGNTRLRTETAGIMAAVLFRQP